MNATVSQFRARSSPLVRLAARARVAMALDLYAFLLVHAQKSVGVVRPVREARTGKFRRSAQADSIRMSEGSPSDQGGSSNFSTR